MDPDVANVETRRAATLKSLHLDDDDRAGADDGTTTSKSIVRKYKKKHVSKTEMNDWNGRSVSELWQRYDLSKAVSRNDTEEAEALEDQINSRGSKRLRENSVPSSSTREFNTKKTRLFISQKYSESDWERMFNLLLAFREKNHHTGVPPLWEEDPDLAVWVQRQRQVYRETLGSNLKYRKFANDKEARHLLRLHKINFIWDYQRFSWDIHYVKLKQIIKEAWEHNVEFQNAPLLSTLGKDSLTKDMKAWIKAQIQSLEDPHQLSADRQVKLDALFQMNYPEDM